MIQRDTKVSTPRYGKSLKAQRTLGLSASNNFYVTSQFLIEILPKPQPPKGSFKILGKFQPQYIDQTLAAKSQPTLPTK